MKLADIHPLTLLLAFLLALYLQLFLCSTRCTDGGKAVSSPAFANTLTKVAHP
jgi:hypothetical protein